MNYLTIWSNPVDNTIAEAASAFFDKLPEGIKEFITVFSDLGEYGIFIVLLGIIFLFWKTSRKVGFALLLGGLFTLIFNDGLFKNIFQRTRPFLDPDLYLISVIHNNNQVYGTIPSSYSFPSGHSFCAFAGFGGVLFLYIFDKESRTITKPLSIFLGIYAFLLASSRVLLSHHYFTDVLAGSLFGILFGYLSYLLIKYTPVLYSWIKLKIDERKNNK